MRIGLDCDGICGCGCGGKTKKAPRTQTRRNGTKIMKGEYYEYIHNHHLIGRTRPSRPDLQPTKVPTEKDIMWVAGFYEGEGTCGRHRRQTQIFIGQKQLWPLEKVREFFGGSFSLAKDSGVTYLHLHGENARRFMKAIYPYLSPRRQAQARKSGYEVGDD